MHDVIDNVGDSIEIPNQPTMKFQIHQALSHRLMITIMVYIDLSVFVKRNCDGVTPYVSFAKLYLAFIFSN